MDLTNVSFLCNSCFEETIFINSIGDIDVNVHIPITIAEFVDQGHRKTISHVCYHTERS